MEQLMNNRPKPWALAVIISFSLLTFVGLTLKDLYITSWSQTDKNMASADLGQFLQQTLKNLNLTQHLLLDVLGSNPTLKST